MGAPVVGVVVPHVEGDIPGVDDRHLQVVQAHVCQLVAPAALHHILRRGRTQLLSKTMPAKQITCGIVHSLVKLQPMQHMTLQGAHEHILFCWR